MKKTILNSEAKALNAKMVNFAGWEMPISFTSIIEEVKQVRINAGVFDVSHMGEFVFEGDRVVDFINWLLPNNFKDLNEDQFIKVREMFTRRFDYRLRD